MDNKSINNIDYIVNNAIDAIKSKTLPYKTYLEIDGIDYKITVDYKVGNNDTYRPKC